MNESPLSIFLLGQTRVLVHGEDITSRVRPKSLAFLKALADKQHKGFSREVLAELLWPDSTAQAAFVSLKVEAHSLRRALGCDARGKNCWVIFDRGSYRLTDDVWIDAQVFEKEVRSGRVNETKRDLTKAEPAYRRAASLYVGDYLAEDPYEDWTLITRERLRDLYLHTLGRLASFAVTRRDYVEAIELSHQILQSDPCREDIYRILILAHGSLGQYGRSTAWYKVAVETMRQELGCSVSRETTAIYERLFQRPNNSVLTAPG